MTRPMALGSGTSDDAEGGASPERLGRVRAGILELLREHPGTDEDLAERYQERTSHPAWPRVTDQRLRTARAHLVRAGLVRDSGALAFSTLGNRATLWEAVPDPVSVAATAPVVAIQGGGVPVDAATDPDRAPEALRGYGRGEGLRRSSRVDEQIRDRDG